MVNKLGGGPEVDYHTQELEDMRDLKRQVVLISTSEVHPGPLREREHPPPPPPRLCSPRPALGSGGRSRAAGQLSGRAGGRAPPAGLGPRAPGVLQTDWIKQKNPRVFSQHTTTNQNTGMKGKLKNAKQTSCIPYFEILGKNYYLCTIHKTLLNMESRHQILLDSVFRMSLAWIGFSQIWHFVTAWT